MRSSTTFLAAAATLLSFAAATPLEARYETCIAPQQWHICGDGWSGCCSVSPCKGPSIASNCPDQGSSGPRPTPTEDESPPATSAKPEVDEGWHEFCKEDDSQCNWNATFYHIKNYDEDYAKNSTVSFFVWNDSENTTELRRDAIGVFQNIPDDAKNCSLYFYKPGQGAYYGVHNSGALDMATLDTGDKEFVDAVGGKANWKSTAELLKDGKETGTLDLNNWGWTLGEKSLTNSAKFACKKEIAIHFTLSAPEEGSVIFDQVRKLGQVNNFVQRAGWVIKYDL